MSAATDNRPVIEWDPEDFDAALREFAALAEAGPWELFQEAGDPPVLLVRDYVDPFYANLGRRFYKVGTTRLTAIMRAAADWRPRHGYRRSVLPPRSAALEYLTHFVSEWPHPVITGYRSVPLIEQRRPYGRLVTADGYDAESRQYIRVGSRDLGEMPRTATELWPPRDDAWHRRVPERPTLEEARAAILRTDAEVPDDWPGCFATAFAVRAMGWRLEGAQLEVMRGTLAAVSVLMGDYTIIPTRHGEGRLIERQTVIMIDLLTALRWCAQERGGDIAALSALAAAGRGRRRGRIAA